jgi:hypothetical protein
VPLSRKAVGRAVVAREIVGGIASERRRLLLEAVRRGRERTSVDRRSHRTDSPTDLANASDDIANAAVGMASAAVGARAARRSERLAPASKQPAVRRPARRSLHDWLGELRARASDSARSSEETHADSPGHNSEHPPREWRTRVQGTGASLRRSTEELSAADAPSERAQSPLSDPLEIVVELPHSSRLSRRLSSASRGSLHSQSSYHSDSPAERDGARFSASRAASGERRGGSDRHRARGDALPLGGNAPRTAAASTRTASDDNLAA